MRKRKRCNRIPLDITLEQSYPSVGYVFCNYQGTLIITTCTQFNTLNTHFKVRKWHLSIDFANQFYSLAID